MSRAKGKLRQHVFARAHFECEYCRSPQKLLLADLEVEHIRPKAKGGETIDDNLCAACRKCNELKRTKIEAMDPDSGERVPLYNPRTQKWSDHFEFSGDGAEILGKTKTGRATVAALQLNRQRAVLLRSLWMKVGWLPPAE
jgi:hypothetical protein